LRANLALQSAVTLILDRKLALKEVLLPNIYVEDA
jgi:hypothetical protein